MKTTETRTQDGITLTITFKEGVSQEKIDAEFKRQFAMSRGTNYHRLYARKIGSFRFAWRKEVGPPIWNRPKPLLQAWNEESVGLMLGIGWRYTCYQIYVAWMKR